MHILLYLTKTRELFHYAFEKLKNTYSYKLLQFTHPLVGRYNWGKKKLPEKYLQNCNVFFATDFCRKVLYSKLLQIFRQDKQLSDERKFC